MAILCHCIGVSHRVIAAAVHGGARDLDDVSARCGAGSVCGGCHASIDELLADRPRLCDSSN